MRAHSRLVRSVRLGAHRSKGLERPAIASTCVQGPRHQHPQHCKRWQRVGQLPDRPTQRRPGETCAQLSHSRGSIACRFAAGSIDLHESLRVSDRGGPRARAHSFASGCRMYDAIVVRPVIESTYRESARRGRRSPRISKLPDTACLSPDLGAGSFRGGASNSLRIFSRRRVQPVSTVWAFMSLSCGFVRRLRAPPGAVGTVPNRQLGSSRESRNGPVTPASELPANVTRPSRHAHVRHGLAKVEIAQVGLAARRVE